MKSHISKVRIAALTVGLAIVMSSCGIQNQAGDSSSASAGKTKNAALVNGQLCYESQNAYWDVINSVVNNWNANYYVWFPQGNVYPRNVIYIGNWGVGVDYQNDPTGFADAYWAPYRSAPKIGGCEELIALAGDTAVGGTPTIAAGAVYVKECVKPEVRQAMIDGYQEQIAKTDYPADWSDATIADYQNEMKRGLATAEKICTN